MAVEESERMISKPCRLRRPPSWYGARPHPWLRLGRLLHLRHAQRGPAHCKGKKGYNYNYNSFLLSAWILKCARGHYWAFKTYWNYIFIRAWKLIFWTQLFEPFLLDQDFKGGAWCPARPIQEGVEEWLEVDLGRQHIVTATETMGRYVGVELFGWPGQAAYCHSMGILFTMDNFSFLRNLVRSMWKCLTPPPGLEVDAARSLRRLTASNTGEPAPGTHTRTSQDTRWEPRTKLLKNTWKNCCHAMKNTWKWKTLSGDDREREHLGGFGPAAGSSHSCLSR